MKNLIKEIFGITNKSGYRLKPGLLLLIIAGTIFESLSAGLVVPVVIILSSGNTSYSTLLFNFFKSLTGVSSYQTFFLCSLIFIVVLYFCKTVFIAFINAAQNRFIFNLEVQLSGRLLKMYLQQPYVFHLHHNSAQLTKNIYYDVRDICLTISHALTLLSEGLILILLGALLLYVKPLLTMAVILFIITVVLVVIRLLRRKLKVWAVDRHKSDRERLGGLSNTLNCIKDIKLYGRYQEFYKHYKKRSETSAYALMKYANLQKLPNLWLEFTAITSLSFLIGLLILQGNALLSIIPLLSLYAAAMFRILPSFNRVSGCYQIIKLYRPVLNSVYQELENAPPAVADSRVTPKTSSFKMAITLNAISFTHQGSTNQLFKELSFTILKGNYIGLIGESGSGKSTLVDIIIGLLIPNSGSVKVDDVNIINNLRNWQNQIGYVAQSIMLMDDTIRRNIALGIPDEKVDEQLLQQAIIDAQLDDFINSLPLANKTLVGERGVRLSGGQRQRVGIARALYNNPSFLVLDEATSSLDIKTEAEIMRSVNLLRKTKTIIFVTHKYSLLKNCDQVFEIREGILIKKQARI